MSESEESVIPSTMNLSDLLEMAISPIAVEDNQVLSSNQFELTDAQAVTSVPDPTTGTGLSYELQINYNESLAERIGSLANKEILSDVTLVVGDEKAEIKAHKLILAISSPVFTSMFYSPLLESRDIVEIPDCRLDSFHTFIQFLYGGLKVPSRLPTGNDPVPFILGVLYAARKYAVKGLEDICAVALSSSLNAANVFEILNASNLHSMPVLDSECWEFMEQNTEAVLEQNVLSMDIDVLSVILKNEHLHIKEVKLFEFVMKWIDYECGEQQLIPTRDNKLSVGNKLLELVRFPAMTPTEFADSVIPTGILSVEQIAKIFTYMSASTENKSLYPMEFPVKKREPKIRFQLHSQLNTHPQRAFVLFDTEQRNEVYEDNAPAPWVLERMESTEEELPRSTRRSRRARRRNSNRNSIIL